VTALVVKVALASKAFSLDVAFEVPAGITVLFGPSGAGKSRTLACIAGIATPDRGRVALGQDVWFDSDKGVSLAIHRRRAAYVFQSLALFPHMTARDNVAYGVARDVPAPERAERARKLLATMHVEHLADRKPQTFSGGEAQRVALARALAMAPRVLLLDEPFNALDAHVKRALLAEVKDSLARERIPTLLVTHDPEEARVLGERVIFLEGGRVSSTSSIDDAALAAPKQDDAANAGERG
jgi:molybdate transport system ATP-binding protein